MDAQKVFNSLLKIYGEERVFKKDAYYSIQKLAENEMKFERAVSGPCGESIPAPSIKVRIEHGKFIPFQLTDLKISPIRLWKEERTEEMQLEFEKLLQKFQEKS